MRLKVCTEQIQFLVSGKNNKQARIGCNNKNTNNNDNNNKHEGNEKILIMKQWILIVLIVYVMFLCLVLSSN